MGDMHWLRARRVLLVFPLVLLWVFGSALPAASVTKGQVDAACASSQAALDEWDAAAGRAAEALGRYNQVNEELESVSLRVLQLRDRIEEKQTDVADIRQRVVGRAVEMYMDGGSQVAEFVLSSSSVDEVLTGQEFLEVITEEDISSLDHLAALKNDMERWQEELKVDQERLVVLNQEALDVADLMEDAMNKKEAAYRTLSDDCRKLRSEYDAQLAAAAAAAAARAKGASGGVPSSRDPRVHLSDEPWCNAVHQRLGFPALGRAQPPGDRRVRSDGTAGLCGGERDRASVFEFARRELRLVDRRQPHRLLLRPPEQLGPRHLNGGLCLERRRDRL